VPNYYKCINHNKLKFYKVDVNHINPHDYQMIELFRKIGDKLLLAMDDTSKAIH